MFGYGVLTSEVQNQFVFLIQLNEYEAAPYFLQLNQLNMTSD